MYTSLTHTILPLSLLGTTLAGVIRFRGEEDNSNSDPKKHHEDPKKDDDHHDYNETSLQFIGCVARTFFNLVSSDDNFDGDFTEQPDLATCIDHCVDEEFRYTYWDADRKQCYCSPAQRPDADQIRDNDPVTGRCKTRDAIVFLNNANFKFGGCFDQSSVYGVQPVARFSTTSVRDCFVLCDEPCRDNFIEIAAITPRFDPALYDFAYDCQCIDIAYEDLPPLVNRTCAIDSIFGYAREEYHHDNEHKKEIKRGEYDYDYNNDYEHKKGDHDDDHYKGEDQDEDDYKGKHHEEDYDEEEDYNKGDHEEDSFDHHKKDDDHHPDPKKNDDDHKYKNHKDHGYEEYEDDNDHGKDQEEEDDEDDYEPKKDDDKDHNSKHHEEDDEEDYDHKKHDDKDHDPKHHKDDDDQDDGKKHHKEEEEDENDHDKDYNYDDDEDEDYDGKDHHKYGKHDDTDAPDYSHNKKGGEYHNHDADYDYDYGYYRA